MNNLVICDLDGTLIDSRADLTTAINKVRKYYELPPISIETVTSYIGDGVKKLVERSLAEIDANIPYSIKKMQQFYQKHMFDKTTIYPTVLEGLTLLRENNFKLAVATNKQQNACEEVMNGLNMSSYFDIILGGSSAYKLKPDPAMLLLAIKQADSSTKNSWIIGDNHTDLASGKNANIKCCFAEYGFGSIGKEKFDFKVNSFEEFAKYLVKNSKS